MKKRNDAIKKHEILLEKCNKIKDQLLAINGVVDIGIGFKVKNGKWTTETGITVFVEKKIPENKLKAVDIIPKKINGILVDVLDEPVITKKEADPNNQESIRSNPPVEKLKSIQVNNGGSADDGSPMYKVDFPDTKSRPIGTLTLLCSDSYLLGHKDIFYPQDSGDYIRFNKPILDPNYKNCCCGCSKGTPSPTSGHNINLIGSRYKYESEAALASVYDSTSDAFKRSEDNKLTIIKPYIDQDITTNLMGTPAPTGKIRLIRDSGTTIYIDPSSLFQQTGYLGAAISDLEHTNNIVGMLSYEKVISSSGLKFYSSISIKEICTDLNIDIDSLYSIYIKPIYIIDSKNLYVEENWQDDPLFKKYKAKLEVSPFGSELISLLEKHKDEVENLVNKNKTVTVVWHNNNGPEFAKQYSDIVQNDQRQEYPKKIGNVTLEMLVSNMTMALHQEGSQSLKEDIQKYSVKILSNIQNISQKANTLDEVINEINKISPNIVN